MEPVLLHDDHTTVEQSKKLMELGLPYQTARSKFYNCSHDTRSTIYAMDLHHSPKYVGELPCWSTGILQQILKACITDKQALAEIFEGLRDCVNETNFLVQVFKEYSDVIDYSRIAYE